MIELDFQTGKLDAVAKQLRPDRRREYQLLAFVLVLTLAPICGLLVYHPLLCVCLVLFAAYFQVLATFARSTSTLTSHHIRFLLAGSNPIGVTGASSLILGAVDAIVDWREDAPSRARRPFRFWATFVYKFAMTPVGLLLMFVEYAWDVLLLRRARLVMLKWRELFSLAWYHDFICPEKSNDLFYADMAWARYREDPYLYQWNRLRALVFEFEHYRIEFNSGCGVPQTNIYWQDDVTAYHTLKRLKVEAIERAVGKHFEVHPKMLPIPPKLGARLVHNARPLEQYLRTRPTLARTSLSEWERELHVVFGVKDASFGVWHVLRLLEGPSDSITDGISRYVSSTQLTAMADQGLLELDDITLARYRWTSTFRSEFRRLLETSFVPVPDARSFELRVLPTQIEFEGQTYTPLSCVDR